MRHARLVVVSALLAFSAGCTHGRLSALGPAVVAGDGARDEALKQAGEWQLRLQQGRPIPLVVYTDGAGVVASRGKGEPAGEAGGTAEPSAPGVSFQRAEYGYAGLPVDSASWRAPGGNTLFVGEARADSALEAMQKADEAALDKALSAAVAFARGDSLRGMPASPTSRRGGLRILARRLEFEGGRARVTLETSVTLEPWRTPETPEARCVAALEFALRAEGPAALGASQDWCPQGSQLPLLEAEKEKNPEKRLRVLKRAKHAAYAELAVETAILASAAFMGRGPSELKPFSGRRPTCPEGAVLLPGGTLSGRGVPATLEPFCLDRTEAQREGRPWASVSWAEATAECERRGGRLPTEAEWEWAAGGVERRPHPWGDASPSCELAPLEGCGNGPAPVDAHPGGASPEGVLGLAGNLREWTADRWSRMPFSGDPRWIRLRAVRGGSWRMPAESAKSTYRGNSAWPESTRRDDLGFRCAFAPR